MALKLAERITDSELTTRETEVLKLLTKGRSNQEIATALALLDRGMIV